jgi:signal transduction histidine kinase
MVEFFQKLFATDFMPHGHCYFWRPEIVWLHVLSDGLTALAYFIIPFVLVRLVRKRRDLAFDWMFVLFGVFILACGATHLMSIWTLWHPVYRLEGAVKAVTALASLPTAFLLIRLLPNAISLPSPEQLRSANRALESEVADRKAAEERVRTLNADLEQRVAARTRDLEIANEHLERMNEDLRHFAYAASHDLQEPLRMVVTYNQLLVKDFSANLPESARRCVGFSIEGALRMQDLLSGLREYWQASESGEDRRTLVQCADALHLALQHLDTAIAESGAVVTHDELPALLAEEVMLSQLFQNLIGNAIKYRGEQPPRIHIGATRNPSGWLFTVTDNGIGIPAEHRETVFGVFKRLHAKNYPGVGMGLALCRKLVERHGGRIWVDQPDSGQGSAFKFTVPIETTR